VRLTVIGCAGSFPGPTSPASCYLLEHDGAAIALDLGNGALGPLAGHTDIRALDAVVLSHLHADHCLDLTSMYVARKYNPDGPPPTPLPVHGPRGTGRRIADAYRTMPGEPVEGLERIYSFAEHTAEPTRIGPFTVTVTRVAHPVPAFAIRVQAGGASVVYSGDTGPCAALVDIAQGADLALFEASFLTGPANPTALHLTGVEAGQHARDAGVGRLVLTHLVSWNDPQATLAEGRSAFDGELALAAPGMVVEL
jgi:ribonuclease BN (tRNA processing enzyme)